MWFKIEEGKIRPVTKQEVDSTKISSQAPVGTISLTKQKSGWIAKTADGRMFDEENHEWSLVPKDLILDVRLLMSNNNVAIPKLDELGDQSPFVKFMYLKGGDGRIIGAGALLRNSSKAMYLVSLNKNDGVIFTVDYVKNIEMLPMVSSITFVEKNSIEGDVLHVELPSKMIIIPKRDLDQYFFQYKDGALLMRSVGGPILFGQVIGLITNNIGNCIVLYYDQRQDKCLVSVDNIFNMKVSLAAQGLPAGIFTNPITGMVA